MIDTSKWSDAKAPSLTQFQQLARMAFERLPEPMRQMCGNTTIMVAEFPEQHVLDQLKLNSPLDLLGLFEGLETPPAGSKPPADGPGRVWLFRRSIIDYWAESNKTLGEVITHVLVHEIGHHFGLSDRDMNVIETMGRELEPQA